MKLSVIIITKNEQDNIKKCLESVTWADEVVLVDALSEDKTVEIAQRHKARIFQQEWLGYGRQRNYGIQQASNEWIFFLDADEIVTDELKSEILQRQDLQNEYVAYKIPRKFIFQGKFLRWGGCYPDYQIRLFRKNNASYDDALVHEKLIVRGRIGVLRNAIVHYSYKNLTDYFDRFNLYSSLDAQKRHMKGQKFNLCHIFRFPVSFIVRFFFKLGFLDGYPGFLWAMLSSFYDFAKFAKLKEKNERLETQ